eukprot:SAG31_NODE_861_length_11418_cov_5.107430_1_plen_93_part_00
MTRLNLGNDIEPNLNNWYEHTAISSALAASRLRMLAAARTEALRGIKCECGWFDAGGAATDVVCRGKKEVLFASVSALTVKEPVEVATMPWE